MAYNRTITYEQPAPWLDSEVGMVLKTYTGEQTNATEEDDRKVIKSGTVYPANATGALGIVFEDEDLTYDETRPISVLVAGRVIESRLAVTLDATAKTELEALGIVFVKAPEATL